MTALHLAAAAGHRLVVDELLERGARLDIRDAIYGGTPLGRTTWFSRTWPTPERDETRRALAARSSDVFDVCYAGDDDRLAALLADNPTLARLHRDDDGRSALHVVAGRDVPQAAPLIDLLLRHGADLAAVNHKGETPLDLATAAEADAVVDLLVQRGARRRQ